MTSGNRQVMTMTMMANQAEPLDNSWTKTKYMSCVWRNGLKGKGDKVLCPCTKTSSHLPKGDVKVANNSKLTSANRTSFKLTTTAINYSSQANLAREIKEVMVIPLQE